MSKSRKKKSEKARNTSQTLAALALVISLVSLGLSLYQIFLAPQGPRIYEVRHDDIYYVDGISMIDYPSQLQLTYQANPGDTVILEFSCEIYLNPSGTTTLQIQFENNGTFPTPRFLAYSDTNIFTSGYMKHQFEPSTGGEFDLAIWLYIDDETNSYIRYSVLTVTVY
jgi:hypothetical protein